MSTRRHKRRRIDTDSDPVASEQSSASPLRKHPTQQQIQNGPESGPSEEAPTDELDTEAFAKERDIWDAFREEHYELLEQLPISIHRDFTLIQELDQQAQELTSNLTPTILKYIALRRTLAAASDKPNEPAPTEHIHESNGALDADGSVVGPQSPKPNGTTVNGKADSTPPAPTSAATSNKGRTPSISSRPLSVVAEPSQSTRELLTSMAQSVEEISRASVEKQYLAQHVCDLVDRYIRDLDRSIKEQEASISLGLRPGTHPASIILPELVVPQFKRTRAAASPPPLELDAIEDPLRIEIAVEPHTEPHEPQAPAPAVEEPPPSFPLPQEAETEDIEIIDVTAEPADGPVAEPAERAPSRVRRGRKRRKSAKPKSEKTAEPEQVTPEEENAAPEGESETAARPQPPLMLKIPAQSQAAAPILPEGEPPDPDEPRYCFCNQVSYGDMIACDNPTCAKEWFHMGCVGLVRPPKGKWYCRECAEIVKKPKGKKRAR
ncbi:hypothetical protein BD309DRAFT_946038 [Dichomitus squalens]|uniref:Chromatin modification-related protein n=1 Tax=Dichomitus squalens TaxID=114155 RepID=A0A4Q9PAS2_9APHY|nr:hypothetical protein BD309DRAFT_946038 [Dichomitus squalens]TBU66193.1 hypothetical protein BD310DRAFT_954186 [Dichomitus squalens]